MWRFIVKPSHDVEVQHEKRRQRVRAWHQWYQHFLKELAYVETR